MIRVICPNCEAKLNAKEHLLGHMRNCPNCGVPFQITDADAAVASDGVPATASAPAPSEQPAAPVGPEGLPTHRLLDRLNRHYHYLVCDRTGLLASWQNNGEGWMLKTHTGMVPASRNRGQVLSHGDFKLVELKLQSNGPDRRLIGIRSYQLAEHYALSSLERGDDQIVDKITGPGRLNREQKNVVRTVIKDQFMYEVWKDGTEVLEYLASTDYHSPGVG
jgi:hypothetical protein